MNTTYRKSWKLKLAKSLFITSGFFPLSVGTFFYFYTIILGDFNYLRHIAFTNLMATGLTIVLLVFFEFEHKKPWVIALLFFMFAWVGGNDTYALVREYYSGSLFFPIAIVPTILSALGFVFYSLDLLDE